MSNRAGRGDFSAWANRFLGQRRAVERAVVDKIASPPTAPPVLVNPAGVPIQSAPPVAPPGTIPWGLATPATTGAPPAQTVRGYVPPRPPSPVFTMQPRPSVQINKQDARDVWAEHLATLPELLPPAGDANAGQYNEDSLAALRAAASGSSGARHTLVDAGGSYNLPDSPVAVGGMMAPAEYSADPFMPAARIQRLQPRAPAPQAPAPPPAAPYTDPVLESMGMGPTPTPPADAPPPAPAPPAAKPAPHPGKQLSLLGDR